MGSLKIIAGEFRGRVLKFPDVDEVRPVTGLIKKSVFDMLSHIGYNRIILDLFAGSGSLGLEAISRGAEKVVFIEENPELAESIQKNIDKLGVNEKCEVFCKKLPGYLQKLEDLQQYGCIFIDPPFFSELVDKILNTPLFRDNLGVDTLLVARPNVEEEVTIEGYEILRDRSLGDSRILILKKG